MLTASPTTPIVHTIGKAIGLLVLLVFGAAVGIYGNLYGEHVVLMLGTPLLIPLGLLLFVNPRLLFLLLIGTRCALDPILDSAQFGAGFGLGGILNLLVIACAAIICIQSNKGTLKQSALLWIFPILVMMLSASYAPDIVPALKRLIAFISYFAVFTIGMIFAQENQLRKLLRIIVLSAILPLIVGIYQLATGNLAVEGRLAATFTHPNIYAFYCLLVLVVLLYLSRTRHTVEGAVPRPFTTTLLWLLFVLLLGSIVLTQTRSAWVALILIGLIYGAMFSRKILIWMIVGLLAASMLPAVQERIIDLFTGNEIVQYGKLNSFAWRQFIWESGLKWMSPSHYLLGYGIGGFYEYSTEFFPHSGGYHFGAHNVFVERFFDGGLVAVAAFAVFFVAQLTKAVKLFQHDRFMALIYLSLILSYLTLNASDNVVDYLAYNWYYWVVAGAFYANAHGILQRNRGS